MLSTGDELVEGGAPLRPGQIRESNRPMLLALVAEAGAEAVDLGLVRDDEAELAAVIERAATECDALVTSGGVSMGDFDVVKLVLDKIGRMRWMQMAIKPAKPFAFGLLGADEPGTPVFGLPGNPVSSMVSFELLRPAGAAPDDGSSRPGPARGGGRGRRRAAPSPRRQGPLRRVHGAFGPDGRLHVRSTGAQGSHQLAATAGASALAVVPDGDGVAPGGDVRVLLLTDL